MSTDPTADLRFILPDGSIDRGMVEAVARTRAVTHACCYSSDERAYLGELSGVEAEAAGERDIWAVRTGIGVVQLSGWMARELSTDGPLPSEAA